MPRLTALLVTSVLVTSLHGLTYWPSMPLHFYSQNCVVEDVGLRAIPKVSLRGDPDYFSNDPGARGDLHLAHDQPEKRAHRVRTNAHLIRDLLARHSFRQEKQCFLLARRQVELCSDSGKVCDLAIPAFEQCGVCRVGTVAGRGSIPVVVQGEDADRVLPSPRLEGRCGPSPRGRAEWIQEGPKLVLNMSGEGMDLPGISRICQDPNRFRVVAEKSKRKIVEHAKIIVVVASAHWTRIPVGLGQRSCTTWDVREGQLSSRWRNPRVD